MKSRMLMFTLSDHEIEQLEDFMDRHRDCCDGDFDSALDFIFHPSAEGMLKSVVCCWCGKGMYLKSYAPHIGDEENFEDFLNN